MEIGIIGFGRFGQLLAKILKKGNKIAVYDIKDKTREAKKIGVPFLSLNKICKRELIILAVPISEMEKVLKKIRKKVKKEQIVMDTCSVKEYPVRLMKKYLSGFCQILACHPMFGPDSAKDGLSGLQIVFYRVKIKKNNYQKIKKIFQNLGLEILEIDPKEHDRQTAISLCLTHFIGRALERMKFSSPKITTLGFKKLKDVAFSVKNDSWQLFEDIQKYNRFAKIIRKRFLKALLKLNKMLEKGGKRKC